MMVVSVENGRIQARGKSVRRRRTASNFYKSPGTVRGHRNGGSIFGKWRQEGSQKGLDAAEKQPVMSAVSDATLSSPLGLGRDPVLRRDDHLLGNDLDLAGDAEDARTVSGLVVAARRSRTCFSTPTSSSSTR